MPLRNIAHAFFSLALAAMAAFAQQPSGGLPLNGRTQLGTGSNANYGKLPLVFEANQGQADPQARFLVRSGGYTAFLTSDSMVLSLRPTNVVPIPQTGNVSATSNNPSVPPTTMQFRLSGATRSPVVVGEDRQLGTVNYFFGNDPKKWRTNVPTYARVRYRNVYPGIDLVYYGSARQLECDFAVSPGANPNRIQFEITGANEIGVDATGNLVLKTNSGELTFQIPVVYQESNGQRVAVEGGYIVRDSTHVAFQVAHYDSTKPLVIDPVLVYSTYLGGSGTDQPTGIAVDSSGSVYVAGYTDSADFPLATLGSLPTNANHAFVAKLDATGSNLMYADYIGGNSQDYGIALVLDASNNVYLAGSTESSNFPLVNPYQAQQLGPYTGFLTKVSADGSSLLYSTYLGGSAFDQPTSVAIDGFGQVHVAGYTMSQNFPVANAYQATVSANQAGIYGAYGFLTKFSPDGSSLVYSTYLAGNSNVVQDCGTPCWPAPYNAVSALAVDANGNAYVTGTTNTYNFPATAGAYQTSNSTQQDASIGFVTKFSGAGTLDYSTYFYGSSGAPVGINAVAVDGSGSAYVAGTGQSDGTFPITSTAICDPGSYGYGCGYAFVTKFDPTGSTLLYSTFLGPNNYASPQALVLDDVGDVYVLASTLSSLFQTNSAIEPYTNKADLLLVEIDPDATTQLFATYLGGSGNDSPSGIALDLNGNLYIAGSTNSNDLPTTQGSFQSMLAGRMNAFVVKIGPESAPSLSLSPSSLQYAGLPVGSTSQPLTVLLRNMGNSPLTITSITTGGDFAETDDCGNSVPAAGNCSFSITFTPTAAGSRSGSILIQDDAAGSPHAIGLSGVGFGAVATLTPAGLTFSAQPVGTSSAPQTVTLTNTGNATLNIVNIQITGDFTQTNNCPASLASTSSCTFNVIFTPTITGARNGTLTINDNAQGSPQTVTLTGTGSAASAPIATVIPTNLVFPGQQLGTSSTAQTVTLTNTGNAALSVGNIQITGDFTQTNNCPASLASTSSCTFNVIFTPTITGARNGTLTINDNAQGSPQTVTLTGTGSAASAPIATVIPTNLVFPGQQLGTSSTAQTVTLTNTGNAALSVGNIQITGDFTQTDNCPATLAPTSSCTFNVIFTPTVTGARNGTLTINDNAQGSPQTVTLTGTGSAASAPIATVIPTNLVFPGQQLGTSSTAQTVTLTNTGNAALSVGNIQITGDFTQTNNCPASLASTSSCTFNVIFTPTVTGARNGTLTINDNAQGSPQVVNLAGVGVDFSLTSSPNSSIVKAGKTATYQVAVSPLGGAFTNMVKLSCSGAPALTACSISPNAVTPNGKAATASLTITTTASMAQAAPLGSSQDRTIYAIWLPLQGIGLFGMILVGSRGRSRKLRAILLLSLMTAGLMLMIGCAGGTGITQPQGGTTPGTYTITVTGTSGTLQHSSSLTLVVQ